METEVKNQIVITDLKFQVNNFKGTDENYDVEVYTQDETENDWYTVEITKVDENYKPIKETMTYFIIDSCGNISDEFDLNEIEQFVVGFLFKPQLQTVIQGF